jgi:predicted esterase
MVMHGQVNWLPPMLAFHGDKDQTVPVEEAHALRKLFTDQKLRGEVRIYPGGRPRVQRP